MNIGIIGSGYIGGTLTRRLAALGHKVFVSNATGPESLKELAEETGAVASTVRESVTKGEIVIITIPQKNITDLPKDLFEGVSDDVIVIDTGNYYPKLRDGKIEGLDDTISDTEWSQKQIGRPLIKAFNSIVFTSLANEGKPKGDPKRIGLPVAGDNAEHKAKVMQLVEDLGYDAVDGGLLKESLRQQPGNPIYCTDKSANEILAYFKEVGSERTPEIMEKIIDARTAQETMVIEADPISHYGSDNHKRQ